MGGRPPAVDCACSAGTFHVPSPMAGMRAPLRRVKCVVDMCVTEGCAHIGLKATKWPRRAFRRVSSETTERKDERFIQVSYKYPNI